MAKFTFELSEAETKDFLAKLAATTKAKPAANKSAAADEGDGLEDVDGEGDGAGDGDGDGDGDDGLGGDDDGLGGDEPSAATRADVQAALRAYAGVSSKADAIKLMKEKGGSAELSKLKEAKFAAVIEAAKLATKKAKKK